MRAAGGRRARCGRRATAALAVLALVGSSATARAEPRSIPSTPAPAAPLDFEAGRVDGDLRLRALTLRDHVVLRYGSYRLRGEHLDVATDGDALRVEGEARLALCPCEQPAVAFAFRSARLTPPGDLVVRFPRLELYGVPVFALPVLWIRAPDRPGLLPPIIAWRGADGMLLGGGVRLPWRGSDGAARALELRAAGYFQGGAELGATLLTPATTTRLVVDELHGDRVALDARGALGAGKGAAIAWEADAIRGDRGRRGTIDLEPAARPFDVASAEGSVRAGSPAISGIVTAGVRARGIRGAGAIVAGPEASGAVGGPLGKRGAWSASAGGLVLGGGLAGATVIPPEAAALPLGRAAIEGAITARPGPFDLDLGVGARASAAGDRAGAPSTDAAIGTRATLQLPLIRSFGANAALVHWIAPTLDLGAALTDRRGAFFTPLGASLLPRVLLASGGVSTSLGRYAGPSARLDLRGGAVASSSATAALFSARLRAVAGPVGASIELAATSTPSRDAPAAGGAAVRADLRGGLPAGATLGVHLAGAEGADPRAARMLTGWTGYAPGGELAYLAAPAWSGGVELSLPLTALLRTGARADADLGTGRLVAVAALAELRHRCGCFALGATALRRIGRDGVDVIVAIDLVPRQR